MKVRLYFDGCKYDRKDEYLIEKEINDTRIELSRIPCLGENITLFIGDYWLEGVVSKVFTCYTEKGNPHRYERSWGEDYAMFVKDIEVYEYYGKREEDE